MDDVHGCKGMRFALGHFAVTRWRGACAASVSLFPLAIGGSA